MSTTIDERIVEMQFDNTHFERNVKVTMSTLDKLKEKLRFDGVHKGIDNIKNSIQKIDLSPVGDTVEKVGLKFNMLYSMADQWARNMETRLENMAINMAKSLSTDQISAGWEKYESKTASVQALMNSTGKSIEEINEYLDELMWFSDETSYSFSDMIQGLATMASSGGDIEKLIPLIEGVANATAFAGKGASEFTRVLQYGINQAYSLGYMQLMDWKTLQSATVNSKQLMQSLIRAGEELGKIKKGTVTVENFTSTLKDKWLDTEVMEKGFGKFSELSIAAYDAVNAGVYKNATEAIEGLSDKYDELAVKAFKAGQEYKSFSEAIDATKDAVSSGWMRSFEIIFGNYEEAKQIWTGVGNMLWEVFASGAEKRNNILETALGSKWETFTKRVEETGLSMEDFMDTLKEVAYENGKSVEDIVKENGSLEKAFSNGALSTDLIVQALGKYVDMDYDVNKSTAKMTEKLDEFQKVFDEVWNGDWGNGQERYDRLTEAGYKYAEVQDLINNYEIGHKFSLQELSDAQLLSIGYTEEQVEAIRDLASSVQDTDDPIRKLIDNLSKSDGRDLLIDSFKNIGEAISKILTPIKESWNRVFPSEDEAADNIYNLISAFHDLTEEMEISDETADRLGNIFDNVFKATQVTTTVFTKSLGGGLKILDSVLKLFGTDILGVAEYIAELIGKFAEWLDANTMMVNPIGKLAKIIEVVIRGVHGMVDAFIHLEGVQKFVTTLFNTLGAGIKEVGDSLNIISFDGFIKGLESFFANIQKAIKDLDGSAFFNAGLDVINGIVLGLQAGIDWLLNSIFDIGWAMIETLMNALDENSPSKEGETIGENFIIGIWQGIVEAWPKIAETLKEIGLNMIDILKNINLKDIFIIGSVAGLGMMVKRIIDIIDKIVNPLKSLDAVFKGFEGSGKAFSGMFNNIGLAFKTFGENLYTSINKNLRSKSLLNIAKAIGILALALIALAYVGKEHGWALAGAVLAIWAIVGALVVLMKTMEKMDGSMGDFAKVGLLIAAVSVGVLMIAIAMKTIEGLGLEGAIGTIVSIGLIITMLGGLIWAFGTFTNRFTSKNIAQAGLMFLGIAVAMRIIASAMKVFGELSRTDILKSITVIGAIGLLMAALMFAFSFVSPLANPAMVKQMGKTFTRLAVSIGILAIAMKVIASMSWSDVMKGIAVLAAVEILFMGLVAISVLGIHADKAGSMFWKFGLAVLILAGAMKIFATMTGSEIAKGLFVVGMLELFFGTFVSLVKFGTGDMEGAGKLFWRMGLALALMAVAMKIIGNMDEGEIIKGLFVIGVLELFIAGIIKVSEKAGQHASVAGSMLMKMSLAILILVGAIALLSLLDPTEVAVGTAAVAALIYMFTLLVKGTRGSKDIHKTITQMTIALGVLAGAVAILALIAHTDPAAVAIAAASISAVVGAFAALMAATKFAKNTGPMMKTLLSLVGIVVVIGLILAGFALLAKYDMETSIETAGAISLLLLALAASTAIMGTISRVNKTPMKALGGVLIALAGIALIMGILAGLQVEPSIESAAALSILLLAMAGVTVILGKLGPGAAVAAKGALAFDAVVAIIGGLLIGLGALMEYVPKAEQFLDKGITVMGKIGEGIGALFGGMVAGAVSKSSEGFVTLAENMKQYGDIMSDTNIDAIKASSDAIKTLVDVAGLVPTNGGLLGAIVGNNDLATFAESLVPFAYSFKGYSYAMKEIPDDYLEAVKKSSGAMKALIEVANTIPNRGGMKAWFTGDNDLATFASSLVPFAHSFGLYAYTMSMITDEEIAAVANSATAIEALLKVADIVPNTGGMTTWVNGDNNLAVFAETLTPFAKDILKYAGIVADLTPESVTAIENSAKAVSAIVKVANSIPDSGGWKAAIFGDNDMTTFGFQMTRLAQGIVEYNKTVAGGVDIVAIENSIKAVEAVSKLATIIPLSGGVEGFFNGNVDYSGFGKGIVDIGKGVKDYGIAVTGINVEAITSSVTAINKLVGAINKMSDIDSSGVGAFKRAIQSLSELSMDDFIAGFTGKEADVSKTVSDVMGEAADAIAGVQPKFIEKGEDTVDWTGTGVTDNVKVVTDAISDVIKDMLDIIDDYDDDFREVGKNLVEGFAGGIDENTWRAEAQATAMAQAAVNAAKAALQVRSPSRVTYGIGRFFDLGFANAIGDFAYKARDAASDMGIYAKNGLNKAISNIASIIDSDIDSQPTIRPVLDLSDISSGVNDMNNMFGMTPSVGVMRNIGSISSMMNRNQNGGNDDVISAIKELGSKFNRTSGDTYQINGVTYDDGSNVSTAVKALVRAAKIERRV